MLAGLPLASASTFLSLPSFWQGYVLDSVSTNVKALFKRKSYWCDSLLQVRKSEEQILAAIHSDY